MSRCNFFISLSIPERSEVNILSLSSRPDFLGSDSYNIVTTKCYTIQRFTQ